VTTSQNQGGDGYHTSAPAHTPRTHPVQRRLLHVVALLYRWAESGWARSAVAAWGFAQSAIVPGPSDVLLIPLGLADPRRVFSLALWTTIGAFFGALVAYAIGALAFDSVGAPLLSLVGIGAAEIERFRATFAERGWLVVVLGALPLLSAKVISIAAGAFGLPIFPFAVAILVGRGARFFAEAAIIRFAGSKLVSWIERKVRRPLETIR
jgi:membrane protein YqaA with SNARE-associated domain